MGKYNSFLGAFFSGDNGQGGYNQAYAKKSLAQLYSSQDPAEQQAAYEGLNRVDPESAQKWKTEQTKTQQANLERKARILAQAPEQYRAGLYQSMLPEVKSQWAEAPDQYTPELDGMIQSWAGGGQGQPKARSSHILADGTIAYMDEYGNLNRTSEKASNNFRPLVGANGEIVGYDPRGNTATPTPMGGNQATPPPMPQGGDPMASPIDRINAVVQAMKEANVPVEQINAWAEKAFADAQSKVSGTGVSVTAPPPAQAKVSVKPVEQKAKEAPAGYQFNADGTLAPIKGGPADPAMKQGAQSLDATKAKEQRAALRQDAINFAAAWLGKTPEEVALLSPDQIRKAMKETDRLTAGPVVGSIWGMGKVANSDLEAYSSSAAAKVARINNPTGPVTEGDFRAAEKGIFSATKPKEVNADLVYQALTGGGQQTQAPQSGGIKRISTPEEYNALPSGTEYIDPNGVKRRKK